jgi:DNA repair protein RadC
MKNKSDDYYVLETAPPLLPRERLEAFGAEVLSDAELLAIVLGSGTKQHSVHVLAQKILERFDHDLFRLKQASLEELQEIDGIGRNKAILLKAVTKLGYNIHEATEPERERITTSFALGRRLISKLKDKQQEHFIALYLDSKNQIIKEKTLFIGSLNQSIAHPREIFKEAVALSACSIIVAHNHPSGDVHPSAEDIRLTKRIDQSAKMMGIQLLDHLIIGHRDYYSLREHGNID